MIWSCPVCHLPLETSNSDLRCASNHSYDLAKEGYCNLLLANQKNSKAPGDSGEMVAARRQILDAGIYQPLSEKLRELVKQYSPETILDMGCGEGYYLGQILKGYEDELKAYGLDISKPAIRRAAKRYKDISFSVASNFQPPVLPASVDLVLRVFAPAPAEVVAKLLKTDGFYLIVTPGENHLRQIREKLYDDVRQHINEPEVPEGFVLQDRVKVSYALEDLEPASISAIVSMTPFQWKGSEEGRAELGEQGLSALEMDFVVSLYRKSPWL
ncbi:MAG: methyltransferase domain-containing protein [Cellvibrionaceae bacterium]